MMMWRLEDLEAPLGNSGFLKDFIPFTIFAVSAPLHCSPSRFHFSKFCLDSVISAGILMLK